MPATRHGVGTAGRELIPPHSPDFHRPAFGDAPGPLLLDHVRQAHLLAAAMITLVRFEIALHLPSVPRP